MVFYVDFNRDQMISLFKFKPIKSLHFIHKNRMNKLFAIKIEKISSITIFLSEQYNQEWELR